MNDLGILLIGASARVTALALLGLSLALILKRRGPLAVSQATLATLSGLVIVSVLSLSPWPRFWNLDFQGRPGEVAQRVQESEIDPAARDTVAGGNKTIHDSRLADFANAFVRELKAAGAAPAPTGSASVVSNWRWPAWVALLLIVGGLAGLVRLALAIRSVNALRRRSRPILDAALREEVDILQAELGCPGSVAVRETDDMTTAATLGWRRPVVLLPADWRTWSPDERRAALAHELAHVRGGDYLSGLWAHACLAVHFYHPLAHWLVARLRLEQELSADVQAARLSGGNRSYLEAVARLALRRPGPLEPRPSASLWPARPFLPTRGTLLRRLEMLRDPRAKMLPTEPLPWLGRASTIALVAVAGLVLAGLRGPIGSVRAQQQAQVAKSLFALYPAKADPPGGEARDDFDLSHAPAETVAVLVGKPSVILTRPEFKPISEIFSPERFMGIKFDELESVTYYLMRGFDRPRPPAGGEALAVEHRLSKPGDWKETLKQVGPDAETIQADGHEMVRSAKRRLAAVKLDDRTLLIGGEDAVRSVLSARENGPVKHRWDAVWSKIKKGQVAVAVDTTAFASLVPKDAVPNSPADTFMRSMAIVGPLVEKASAYAAGFDVDKGLSVEILGESPSDAAAKEVGDTFSALVTLGKNSITTLRKQMSNEPMAAQMLDVIEPLLKNARTEVHGDTVKVQSETKQEIAQTLRQLLPAVTAARSAAKDAQSMNNMKQIMLAFHNYQDVNGHFPPPVLKSKNGMPYSWRVAILPFIDQQALYAAYKFDESWDSPSNQELLKKAPVIFRHPSNANATTTNYVAPVSPDAIMRPSGEGTKIQEILDGTSGTIMLVEAKTDIPWTKPEDLPVGALKDFNAPAPKIPGLTPDGFHAGMADGSVRFFSSDNPPFVLKALFSRDGGEVIDWNKVRPAPGQGRPVPAPPANPTPVQR